MDLEQIARRLNKLGELEQKVEQLLQRPAPTIDGGVLDQIHDAAQKVESIMAPDSSLRRLLDAADEILVMIEDYRHAQSVKAEQADAEAQAGIVPSSTDPASQL